MKIRLATQQDKKRWDAYVETHPQATPYHRFAWGQACEQAYKQPMQYLIAEDEQHQVCGVLPCIAFKRPFSAAKSVALPYCDTGFALGDDDQITASLLGKLRSQSDYRDVSHEPADTEALQAGQKVVLRLPLPENSELLMSSFKSKLRSQIRKAEKNGLTMALSENPNDHVTLLPHFYDVYKQNMRLLASPAHAYSWFESVIAHYGDNARVCVVYQASTPIGAGIVIMNGTVAAIPWASTLPQYNRLAPNMMLYWSLLANVTDAGMQTFDFGRSSFGEGTYKFKTQWGALPYPLNWHDGSSTDHQPQAVETGPPGAVRQLAENVWPKLPLGFTVAIGSAIRRYISL